MHLSYVIPVYNEAESLRELVSQIDRVARANDYAIEILLIDDGSRDASWQIIEQLANENTFVRGLKLRRNFGKAAALAAGFDRVSGQYVITLDADLQDDPQETPNLIAELNRGFDVVSGWKKRRNDPWHKVLPSRVFNSMISRLTGVQLHDHNCGMKIYRREVLNDLLLYGEFHRFIPVLAASMGYRVSEIVVNHRAREHGVSKYGFERFVKGFLDLLTVYFLTSYRHRPQHMLGTVGGIIFGIGSLGLMYLSAMWCLTRVTSLDDLHLHQTAIFYYCILAILLGVQIITVGFLAELITAQSRPNNPPYNLVKDTLATETNFLTSAEVSKKGDVHA